MAVCNRTREKPQGNILANSLIVANLALFWYTTSHLRLMGLRISRDPSSGCLRERRQLLLIFGRIRHYLTFRERTVVSSSLSAFFILEPTRPMFCKCNNGVQ